MLLIGYLIYFDDVCHISREELQEIKINLYPGVRIYQKNLQLFPLFSNLQSYTLQFSTMFCDETWQTDINRLFFLIIPKQSHKAYIYNIHIHIMGWLYFHLIHEASKTESRISNVLKDAEGCIA